MSFTAKSFLLASAVMALVYGCPASSDGAAFGESCAAAGDCESGLCHPAGYCTSECMGSCATGFDCVPARIAGEDTAICASNGGGGAGGRDINDQGVAGQGGAGGGAGGAGGGAGGAGGGAGGAGGGAGGAGGGAGGAGGDGGDDCAAIVACLNACGEDQVCAQTCVEQGSPAAQQLINDALACLQANGGDQAACQAEITACVGAGPQPMGDLTCAELNDCLSNCAEGDQACVDECFGQASAEGAALFQAAGECIQANGGDQAACAAEIEACLGGGVQPMGDLTCGELNGCLNECPENDQECFNGCFGQASAEGQALFEAAVECIQANNGDQAACQAEIEACLGPAAPPGNDNCGTVLQCILGAQTEEAGQACFNGGTEAARTLISAAFNCFTDNMCQDPECPECSAEYNACQADR